MKTWMASVASCVVLTASGAANAQSSPPTSDAPASAASENPPPPPTDSTTPAPAAPTATGPLAADLARPAHPERWVAVALAAGGLIAGGVFGAITFGDQSTFNNAPSQAAADRVSRDGMIADVFLGVGILAAAVAVVLFLEPGMHEHGEPTSGGRAAARARFRMTGTGMSLNF